MINAQGEVIYVDIAPSLIEIDGKRLIQGVFRDITEQKLSRDALKQSEERLRQITENVHEVIWLRNADNSKIIYITPSYEKVWGRPCESLYREPNSFIDAIHYEDKKRFLEHYERYTKGEPFDFEYRIVRFRGSGQ